MSIERISKLEAEVKQMLKDVGWIRSQMDGDDGIVAEFKVVKTLMEQQTWLNRLVAGSFISACVSIVVGIVVYIARHGT